MRTRLFLLCVLLLDIAGVGADLYPSIGILTTPYGDDHPCDTVRGFRFDFGH